MKVALIELGGSHDECLYSQVIFLKSIEGLHLTLICDTSLQENIQGFSGLTDKVIYIDLSIGINRWRAMFDLWQDLRKENFDKIVLNSAQGSIMKKLLLFPFGKTTDIIGVLHNTAILRSNIKQRLIISKKVSRYLLLNDYLIPTVTQKHIKTGSFYPIFFPKYKEIPIQKGKDEIWICIPGAVSLARRDYMSLIEVLSKGNINRGIKFVLLGRCDFSQTDGKYFKSQVDSLGLNEYFDLRRDYIAPDLFHAIIKSSDYIMPLIHPSHVSFRLYSHQVSGGFNLAFAYKKTMLMHEVLNGIEDFKDSSIFYSLETFADTLNSLPLDAENNLYQHEKWDLEYQKKQYLEAILEDYNA